MSKITQALVEKYISDYYSGIEYKINEDANYFFSHIHKDIDTLGIYIQMALAVFHKVTDYSSDTLREFRAINSIAELLKFLSDEFDFGKTPE